MFQKTKELLDSKMNRERMEDFGVEVKPEMQSFINLI